MKSCSRGWQESKQMKSLWDRWSHIKLEWLRSDDCGGLIFLLRINSSTSLSSRSTARSVASEDEEGKNGLRDAAVMAVTLDEDNIRSFSASACLAPSGILNRRLSEEGRPHESVS